MRTTCDRCGKVQMVNEASTWKRSDMLIRDITARMRHDGCATAVRGEGGAAHRHRGRSSRPVPAIVTKRTVKPAKVAPPPANDDRKSAIVITSKRSKLRGEPVSPAAPAGYEEATAHYRAIIRQRLRK
jgi:hypothetical protein